VKPLPPTPADERLSAQLKAIADRCRRGSVSVRELLATLRGSPYLLLTALLSLIFIPPLPLFWLAPIAGVIIALFGLHMALGLKPIIPDGLLNLQLPQKVLPSVLKATSVLLRKIEFLSRPRWRLISRNELLMNFYGLVIFLTSLMLMPPLPIPFLHFFPALTLFVLSLGLVERDGVFIILGLILFFVTVTFFSLLFLGGRTLLEHLYH
jgi:hypothetical protein